MSARKKIDPGWKWDDAYNHSQAIQIGDAIYVSGQVAWDSEGNVVGEGDIKAQTRQALENVRAVLQAAGSSMDDLVKVTVFVTDIKGLLEAHDLIDEYLPNPAPALTGVEATALVFPELLIEIEAIAVKS